MSDLDNVFDSITCVNRFKMKLLWSLVRIVLVFSSFYVSLVESRPLPSSPLNEHRTLKQCVRSGCNNEICVEKGRERLSACEIQADTQCIQLQACVRLESNECGFQATHESNICMLSLKKAN